MTFRMATWNMARRKRAWDGIEKLDADLLLLQEVRPHPSFADRMNDTDCTWNGYGVIYHELPDLGWGSAILYRNCE